MSEVWTIVILPVIATAFVGISGYLGVKLKGVIEWFFANREKEAVAQTVVKAIEQKYKDLHGDEKKQKAIEGIQKMLEQKDIQITELEIEMLLESAVAEFNKKLKK